jgi:diadenosine tetraphosphate (Ap4A) HIT family hydrolase
LEVAVGFEIHQQLQADCYQLGSFQLSRVLLAKDANYPWFILVPQRQNITEIYQLEKKDQHQLWSESAVFSKVVMECFAGHKLNVAALGNMVPQLHLHHIVRYQNDPAWPGPVWGVTETKKYSKQRLAEVTNSLLPLLKNKGFIEKMAL